VTFAPEGDVIASSHGYQVVIWDATTGEQKRVLPGLRGNLAFSPDGALLATTNYSSVNLWNTTSGTLARSLSGSAPHSAMVYSPDGALLVTGTLDNMLQVWNARSGQLMRVVKHEARPTAWCFRGWRTLMTAAA
jgi:WD40 repeat protein